MPLIVRSFGTVLMFLPLSMAALGSIPKKDVAAASGIYNLTRQLGGSVGVALLTTLLGTRQPFHTAVISEKLVVTDPDVQSRLAMLTNGMLAKRVDLVTAKQRALTFLDGSVRMQSAVLAFDDTFWVTAVLVLCSISLIFVLGKPAKNAVVADAHGDIALSRGHRPQSSCAAPRDLKTGDVHLIGRCPLDWAMWRCPGARVAASRSRHFR